MQGWDAVNAALNPFNLARRPTVPTSRGRGRQIVFAVDASSYRWCFFFPLVSTEGDARARPDPHLPPPRLLLRRGLLRPEPHLPAPSRPPLAPVHSEHAVRFGLDHVARSNDACSFACAYRKAAPATVPEPGAFMTESGAVAPVTERERANRLAAETLDRERCHRAVERYAEDAKAMGVASASADVLATGHAAGSGDVADILARYAKTKNADLVVVGSRGSGSAARAALGLVGLGSVSDRLVRTLTRPVLVVKKDRPSEAADRKRAEREDTAEQATRGGAGDAGVGFPPEGGFAKGDE